MKKIKLITDSTADLSPELASEIGVDVIPLTVTFNGVAYLDGVELHAKDLFQLVKENPSVAMPKSASPAPALFYDAFKKYIDQDYDIIFTGIASSMSATLSIAQLVAKEFPEGRIHLVDSKNLSSGIALLLINAARLIKEGKTTLEVVKGMEDVRERTRAQFVVEKLDFLHKGGRVSRSAAILGKAFRARPFIVVANGKMEAVDLPKGKMKRALKHQLKVFEKHLAEGIDESTIFITSTDDENGDEYTQFYLEEITKLVPRANLIIQKAGCVISTHCGTGTIGILYVRNVKNEFNN